MALGTAWVFHESGLLRIQDLLPRPPQDIVQSQPITKDSIHYMLPDDQTPRHVNLNDQDLIEEIQIPIDEKRGRRLIFDPPTDSPVNWGRVRYYGILPASVSISNDAPPIICQGQIIPCQTSGRRVVEWSICAETFPNGSGGTGSIDIDFLLDKSLSVCDAPTE